MYLPRQQASQRRLLPPGPFEDIGGSSTVGQASCRVCADVQVSSLRSPKARIADTGDVFGQDTQELRLS